MKRTTLLALMLIACVLFSGCNQIDRQQNGSDYKWPIIDEPIENNPAAINAPLLIPVDEKYIKTGIWDEIKGDAVPGFGLPYIIIYDYNKDEGTFKIWETFVSYFMDAKIQDGLLELTFAEESRETEEPYSTPQYPAIAAGKFFDGEFELTVYYYHDDAGSYEPSVTKYKLAKELPDNEYLLPFDDRKDMLFLGTDYWLVTTDVVLQKYGEPNRKEDSYSPEINKLEIWYYDSLEITFDKNEGNAVLLTISEKGYAWARGIKIGDKVDILWQKFPSKYKNIKEIRESRDEGHDTILFGIAIPPEDVIGSIVFFDDNGEITEVSLNGRMRWVRFEITNDVITGISYCRDLM